MSCPPVYCPPFVPTAAACRAPLSVGVRCALKHRHSSGYAALPQGPSLRSGFCCPGPNRQMFRPHPAPLAGTARFHCVAAYTPCLRCAFPPRRPTTGSVLSLLILSHMSPSTTPGSPAAVCTQFLHRQRWPSSLQHRLGTPNLPLIRFHAGVPFGASLRFACATTC